jgi:hypothetical protein
MTVSGIIFRSGSKELVYAKPKSLSPAKALSTISKTAEAATIIKKAKPLILFTIVLESFEKK